MRKLMRAAGVLLLMVCVGCLMFDEPQGMDLNGNGIAGEKGWFSRAAQATSVAGEAGVPFAVPIGALLTMIGVVGGHIKAARKTKDYTKHVVGLLNAIKENAATISSDEDVNKLILEYAPPDKSKFGAYLKKIHSWMADQKKKGEAA